MTDEEVWVEDEPLSEAAKKVLELLPESTKEKSEIILEILAHDTDLVDAVFGRWIYEIQAYMLYECGEDAESSNDFVRTFYDNCKWLAMSAKEKYFPDIDLTFNGMKDYKPEQKE